MITSRNRITRRTVLRGAGGAAVALPFLEAMLPPRRTHAAGLTPLRFIVFYTPGGTLLDKWRPSGGENSFTLSDMMAPLNPHKSKLIFLDGLDLSITNLGVGHPHSRGMAGVLTGMPLLPGNFETGGGGASFADGPSVDQVIGGRVSRGLKFRSLEFSSGWSISGRSAGEVSFAADQLTMEASNKPIPPQINPTIAFNRIFGDVVAGDTSGVAAANKRAKSILDAVAGQYGALSARLGPGDRAKLTEHLEMIRQIETSLSAVSGTCTVPGKPTAADAANVGAKGKVMTDLLVASLACDLTRVATMQWADSETKFVLDFAPLMMPDHHHHYQHENEDGKGTFQAEPLFRIYQWYASNLASLLSKLDAIDEGDGTLLDNTLLFAVSELQSPPDHGQREMPFILAGKAQGKVRSGRWLRVKSQPHNNLLVALLKIFGGDDQAFGHPDYNTGALSGLT